MVFVAALAAVALLAVPGRVRRPPHSTIIGALIAVLGVGAASIALSPIGFASHAIPALLAAIVFDAWARAAGQERLLSQAPWPGREPGNSLDPLVNLGYGVRPVRSGQDPQG